MIVSFNGLLVLAQRVEQGSRNENLEYRSGEDRKTAQTQTDQVLVESEGHSAQGLTTVLNARELDHNGHYEDNEEEVIVEKVGKDVDF